MLVHQRVVTSWGHGPILPPKNGTSLRSWTLMAMRWRSCSQFLCTITSIYSTPCFDTHIHIIYIYIHACMHACIHPSIIHTSIHPYIHTSIHPYIHASMHPCIHTSIHPSIHPSVHPSIHPSIDTYIHTDTHTHVHTYIHTYIHTYTHTYIYIYVCIYILRYMMNIHFFDFVWVWHFKHWHLRCLGMYQQNSKPMKYNTLW